MTDLRRAGLPTGFNPDSSQRPRSREGSSPVARPGRRRRLPVWPSRWAPCPERSQAFLRPGVPNGAPQTGRLHCRVSSLRRGVGHRGVGRTGLPPEAPGEGPSRLPPPASPSFWWPQLSLACVCFVTGFGRFTCPTFCDPRDVSPPGSSVYGILQPGTLAWGAFPPPGDLPDPEIRPTFLS